MAAKKTMTSEEKALFLESVAPHIREMDLDLLKRELMLRLRGL